MQCINTMDLRHITEEIYANTLMKHVAFGQATKVDGERDEIMWPVRSPDLTPLDFWLWKTLKVYSVQTGTVEQLKQ